MTDSSQAAVTAVPLVPLRDGQTIPQLGFGTYQIAPQDTERAVLAALEVGYRHLDTAQMYGNEREVGLAVRASGIPREDIFVTSKLNNDSHRPHDARAAFERTLQALDLGYLDLFLIHWPLPTRYDGDYVGTWQVMAEFIGEGRSRSVGVSNFQVAHLELLAERTDLVPAVNQVEVHPYFGNEQVRSYCRRHGIAVEAWSPIAQGAVLSDPTVAAVAARCGRSPAQVVLRWHLQRGDVIFPKSTTPARVQQNFQLFDFELGDEDMALITALDRGAQGRIGPDPDTFDWIPG